VELKEISLDTMVLKIREKVAANAETGKPEHEEVFQIRLDPETAISIAFPLLCPGSWIPKIPPEVIPPEKRTLKNVFEFLMFYVQRLQVGPLTSSVEFLMHDALLRKEIHKLHRPLKIYAPKGAQAETTKK
jgi:hypothetical protein